MSEAGAQETKLTWLGHAAFSITTPKGKVLLIDPWLNNPSNPDVKNNKDPLVAVSRVDYIKKLAGKALEKFEAERDVWQEAWKVSARSKLAVEANEH